MSFLKRHNCHIDFNTLAVKLAGRELARVDRFGRPLVGRRVQVVWGCTIPELFYGASRVAGWFVSKEVSLCAGEICHACYGNGRGDPEEIITPNGRGQNLNTGRFVRKCL